MDDNWPFNYGIDATIENLERILLYTGYVLGYVGFFTLQFIYCYLMY
jgi:hypothetical protein